MSADSPWCPSWCIKEHWGPEVISHEGKVHRVDLFGGGQDPQFLEIRTVQYLRNDGETSLAAPPSMVEIAHHFGNRYRVFNLTGVSARVLGHLLLEGAEAVDGDHVPPAVQEQVRPLDASRPFSLG